MGAATARVNVSHIYMALLPRDSFPDVFSEHPTLSGIPVPLATEAVPVMSIKSTSGAAVTDVVLFGDEKTALDASPSLDNSTADYAVGLTSDGETPTEEEMKNLRRIPDKIPWSIYTIAFIELCERFSYYGTTAVFTNFIQCKWWSLRLDPFVLD